MCIRDRRRTETPRVEDKSEQSNEQPEDTVGEESFESTYFNEVKASGNNWYKTAFTPVDENGDQTADVIIWHYDECEMTDEQIVGDSDVKEFTYRLDNVEVAKIYIVQPASILETSTASLITPDGTQYDSFDPDASMVDESELDDFARIEELNSPPDA